MHDDAERLRDLWRQEAGNAKTLLAAFRRERGRQQFTLAAEAAVCIVGLMVGALLLLGADPTRRIAGVLVIVYSLGAALVAQWSRVAFVRRLARPIDTQNDRASSDANVVRRLTAAFWIMIGLALLFVVANVALVANAPGGLASLAADREKLTVTLGAVVLLIVVSAWQWRSGRRRTEELKRLLHATTVEQRSDEFLE